MKTSAAFSNLGVEPEPDEAVIKAALKFLQVEIYSEEEEESCLQTKVRLYKSSKNKSSCALPPIRKRRNRALSFTSNDMDILYF